LIPTSYADDRYAGRRCVADSHGKRNGATAARNRRRDLTRRTARNVIFFTFDGFGYEDLASAHYVAARHLGGRVLMLDRLLTRRASEAMLAHSPNGIVTDSAAVTTAWATGRKTVNRHLFTSPRSAPRRPCSRAFGEWLAGRPSPPDAVSGALEPQAARYIVELLAR